MRYIRCTLEIDPPEPATGIFIAALAELGFESFEETGSGLHAYIQEPLWQEEEFLRLAYLNHPDWEVTYHTEAIEPQNWNAAWERDYAPIHVRDRCMVRAPFHPKPPGEIPYDIVISPKMSFGTGHHQTTWLMMDFLLDLDLEGKSVLDMGTGTGVLAILSGMKGASRITAVDIDAWAIENCRENTHDNGQGRIEVLQGDVDAVAGRRFDVVLANINRNVLLAHLPAYARALSRGGQLLLSGFYLQDLPALQEAAAENRLQTVEFREQDGWTAVLFRAEIR